MHLPLDLSIYPAKLRIPRGECAGICSTALFAVAKDRTAPTRPAAGRSLRESRYVPRNARPHSREHKINEVDLIG